jgi:hypothetical protein
VPRATAAIRRGSVAPFAIAACATFSATIVDSRYERRTIDEVGEVRLASNR